MTVSLTSNFFANARAITFLDANGVTWTFNASTNQLTASVSGAAGGTVTSVGLASASGDVVVTGATPIMASGAWDLALKTQAGVAAGSYTYAAITVNSKGVITAAASGTAPAVGANPSASIGLSAVNGVAASFLRSDGAPALSQAITPTWSAAHIWQSTMAASGNPLTSATTRVATGLANFKASNTQATSNALAADASLTVTCNETGWYDFEALLIAFESTVGTGGFQFDFNGGSATVASTNYTSQGVSNNAAYANAARAVTAATSLTPMSTSSSGPDWSMCKGVIHVTVAGTFAVRWAQASTLLADPTNLVAGSYIKLTKIG